jgi:hypothetical protein
MSVGLKANVDGSGAIQVGGTDAITLSTGLNATFVQNADLPNTFGFKNRIINGGMDIDQRNNGASVTPVSGQYLLDRWFYGATQTSKATAQQSSTAPTGFAKSFLITSSSAYSVVSSDYFFVQQPIEGFNFSDLAWGTANAATVTLSFWVRSSLTGSFGGFIRNGAANRSYPFTYTISSANTWEQKSVTIAGDTTGTWTTDNSASALIGFSLGAGSTFSGTAGAWAAGNFISATGATSVVGTNGATFYITGVQLEKGSTATSFDYRPYGTELALCQRYYQTTFAYYEASATSGIDYSATAYGATQMRSSPTATGTSTGAVNFPASAGSLNVLDTRTVYDRRRASGTGGAYFITSITLSSEL